MTRRSKKQIYRRSPLKNVKSRDLRPKLRDLRPKLKTLESLRRPKNLFVCCLVIGDSLSSGEAAGLRDKLALVKAKDFISIKETALLLNCSEGYVRNLINKARNGRTKAPIPFTDLDGVTVFNRLALIEWANMPKHKLETSRATDTTSNG